MTNQTDTYAEQIADHLANIDKSLERIAGALRSLADDSAFGHSGSYDEAMENIDDIISAEKEHWKSDKG